MIAVIVGLILVMWGLTYGFLLLFLRRRVHHKANCAAGNHEVVTQRRKGYYSGPVLGDDIYGVNHFRCTVHETLQSRTHCKWCWQEITPWKQVEGYCIQEFSCGPDMMHALDRGEFVGRIL